MRCKYWDTCPFRYINETCKDDFQASRFCGAYRRFEENSYKNKANKKINKRQEHEA